MDYLKYLTDKTEYKRGEHDCWVFVQQIYKEEHNKILPDLPVMQTECHSFLKANMTGKRVKKAHKGCLIYVTYNDVEHSGYALDEKLYIHRALEQVHISPIPQKAIIYDIL